MERVKLEPPGKLFSKFLNAYEHITESLEFKYFFESVLPWNFGKSEDPFLFCSQYHFFICLPRLDINLVCVMKYTT